MTTVNNWKLGCQYLLVKEREENNLPLRQLRHPKS